MCAFGKAADLIDGGSHIGIAHFGAAAEAEEGGSAKTASTGVLQPEVPGGFIGHTGIEKVVEGRCADIAEQDTWNEFPVAGQGPR